MKRFLNQDVVRGSLTASQSLNRYSYVQGNPVSYTDPFGLSPLNGLFTGTNFWRAVLGFIGCVPGPVGMVANLADAAVYALIDHDYGMAALAMLDCVSGGLSTLAKAASAAGKATKSARYLKTAGSLISNVSSFAQNAVAGRENYLKMYEKYMVEGKSFDSSTPWEIASLGLSIVGMGISGKGVVGDAKALSKMLSEDMFSSRMRNAVMEFAADNRGCVNFGWNSPHKLLSGEGNVGTYKELRDAGEIGDNITPHHMPSAEYMLSKGVAKNDGLCMNMEMPSPGIGGRHRMTDTYGRNMTDTQKAYYYSLSPRDALAYDINNVRQIYMSQGLYSEMRPKLQEYIKTYKKYMPKLFNK